MGELFAFSMPLWEIIVRATIVYLVLILLLRAIPKRNAGHISPNDMLTLILVGTLGTDAIMGGTSSVADIVLMIALILLWGYVLDLLEYRFPAIRRVLRDRQASLIEDGRFVRRNMRREMVTEEELMAVLRTEGVEDLAAVHHACMEADGEISVVLRKSAARR